MVRSEVRPVNSADRDHRYIQQEASPISKMFTFECQPCGIRYDNRRQLMRHNRDHHGPKLYCPCGIDLPCSRRYKFVEHQRVCQAVPRASQMLPSLQSLNVLPPQTLVQSVPTVLSTASTSTVPQFSPSRHTTSILYSSDSTSTVASTECFSRYLYCHYL